MNRILAAMLLSGGLLAGAGAPQIARAHGSDEFAVFVAGAAVGYLLSEAVDDHDHHHRHGHGHYRTGYVLAAPAVYYAAPPPGARHYHVIEQPRRYYRHASGHDRWRRGEHRRHHR